MPSLLLHISQIIADKSMDKEHISQVENSDISDSDYVDYDDTLQNVIKTLPPDPLDVENQRLQQELNALANRKQELERPNHDMMAMLEKQANEVDKLQVKFRTVTESLQRERTSRALLHKTKLTELDRKHEEMEAEYETRKHELQVLTEARQMNKKKAKRFYEEKTAKVKADDDKLLNNIEARWRKEYDDRCKELVNVKRDLNSLEQNRLNLENKVRAQKKVVERLEAEGRETVELKSMHERLLDSIHDKEMERESLTTNLAALKQLLGKQQQELSEIRMKSKHIREEDMRMATLIRVLQVKAGDNDMELTAIKEQCHVYRDAMPNTEHMKALLSAQQGDQLRRRNELCRLVAIKAPREMGEGFKALYEQLFPQTKEGRTSELQPKMNYDTSNMNTAASVTFKQPSTSYFGERMRKNMKMFTAKLKGTTSDAVNLSPVQQCDTISTGSKQEETIGKNRKKQEKTKKK